MQIDVRQWARRGTWPRQPADQRCENAYLFGAICPAKGKGAALALPRVDTEMMQLHIKEISRHVANGAHAVLLLDRAKIDAASTAAAQGPRISREGIARESEFFGSAESQSIG